MVVGLFSEGVGVEAVNSAADEAHFNGSEVGAANRADTMISAEGEVDVAGDLDGKTMISLSETGTLRSISNPTGKCWRRLILIDWQN